MKVLKISTHNLLCIYKRVKMYFKVANNILCYFEIIFEKVVSLLALVFCMVVVVVVVLAAAVVV